MRKDISTYQRLIKRIVREINSLQPDSDPKLTAELNKKFRKYKEKIELFAKG